MAENPLLWVEVGVHAVRKKPGYNGVVWSGQALDKYTSSVSGRKCRGLFVKQKSLSQKSNAGRRKKKGKEWGYIAWQRKIVPARKSE